MLFGVSMALVASLGWAVSSIILKLLSGVVDSVSINLMRLWVGSGALLMLTLALGSWHSVTSIPLSSLGCVIVSGILAMAVGDTIYIKSLAMLDASIAFPIAQCAFVVFAGLAAIVWLNESYSLYTVVGAIVVMLGIYQIATGKRSERPRHTGTNTIRGVMMTLFAASIWSAATLALKVGAEGLDPILVAAVRISASAIVLTLLTVLRGRLGAVRPGQYTAKTLLLVASAGILAYGVAGVAYVQAIQLIGAGRTVLLVSTSPLLAIPFAVMILHEKPTRLTVAGIVVSVVGVYIVLIG